MLVRYLETYCVQFLFISSSALMNAVYPLDVNDFIERKLICNVLLCKNIKQCTEKNLMYICKFLCLSDIRRGKGIFSIFEYTVGLFILIYTI